MDTLTLFSQAILKVHAARSIDELTEALGTGPSTAVACDACLVNWFGLPSQPVITIYRPELLIGPDINEAAHQFLHQHPAYGRRHGATRSMSDYLSKREWHRTAMYAETYRRVGLEDGLGLDFDLGSGRSLTIELIRSRRGFGVRERRVLDAFRPHIRQAYDRLASGFELDGPLQWQRRHGEMEISAQAVIAAIDAKAQAMMHAYFGTGALAGGRLPDGLGRWFQYAYAGWRSSSGELSAPPKPIRFGRPAGVLTISFIPGDEHGTVRLRLDERSHLKPATNLSAREREVLGYLVRGKTNAEIAILAGAARGTIKRHLENIYAKMQVDNRHGAVMQALRMGIEG